MKVAIPRRGEYVAPRLEYASTITIFTIRGGKVTEEVDFPMQSSQVFDRLRLLRDLGVDTLICGGVEECYQEMLRAHGLRIISWVSGSVRELAERFAADQLTAGARPRGGRNRKGRSD